MKYIVWENFPKTQENYCYGKIIKLVCKAANFYFLILDT